MKTFFFLCLFLRISLISNNVFSLNLYQSDTLVDQYTSPLHLENIPAEQHAIDELKPYKKHISFHINLGHWQQAKNSQVASGDVSFVNIAEYHFKMGAQVEYNFTEALSIFLDLNGIIIPKEEGIQGISLKIGQGILIHAGKGGIIVPYGLGLRYAWTGRSFRPFISSTIGATYIYIGSGNISIGLKNNFGVTINEHRKQVFQYNLGGGFDYRLSQIFSFRFSTNYWLSSQLSPPIGAISAFQGLSVNLGLVVIPGK